MTPRNYIADQNKFHLSGPPVWWLHQLHSFDESLVVVPSRMGFYYRLAQKRPLLLPERMVNDLLFKESDTQMLASYGLVPVTTILATANWSNPLMWEDLRQRAPWRMGGAEKVSNAIEAREKQAEEAKQAHLDESLTHRAKDAWGYYKKKIGIQSHMWIPKTSQPTTSFVAPHVRTSSKSAPYRPEVRTSWGS